MLPRFDIYLLKPTRYDDDGYPLQWWRSLIPSNSLACVAGLVHDSLARGALPGVAANVIALDEVNCKIDPAAIIKAIRRRGSRAFIALVGVQSNQFPRAVDLARPFLAAGLSVCVGGFHVSGCLAMLKELPPDLVAARDLGLSFFAGEAEDGRMDDILRDAYAGELKPLYDFLKHTPNLAGAPVPLLPKATVDRTFSSYSSFDLGRGCPYECSFCSIINVQGRKSRFRTPDDLERIVRANAALGISGFFLTDDNFARNKHWEAFLDRLIALKAEGLTVRLNIQVDTLAHKIPRFVDKCWQAGAHHIFIGLENINADNLAAAKKRQNRVEDYRAMMLAWKQYAVVITCGYIVGFPNDTAASIARDIEMLKQELAVDTIYLNYLTPLPGSEDHQRLYEAGTWMDPDMNKYDLNHRVTHHPRMSDAEWEAAYTAAHRSFYSWEHIERILRRTVALRSNKRFTTIHRLLGYREAVRLENCAFLEAGIIRIKRRRQRRHGLPLEHPLVFYPKYAWHLARVSAGLTASYLRLRWILRRVMSDPNRLAYTDTAIQVVADDADDALVLGTRGSAAAADRRRRLAQVGAPAPTAEAHGTDRTKPSAISAASAMNRATAV
jgi:hypothetical protein